VFDELHIQLAHGEDMCDEPGAGWCGPSGGVLAVGQGSQAQEPCPGGVEVVDQAGGACPHTADAPVSGCGGSSLQVLMTVSGGGHDTGSNVGHGSHRATSGQARSCPMRGPACESSPQAEPVSRPPFEPKKESPISLHAAAVLRLRILSMNCRAAGLAWKRSSLRMKRLR
jgi:hypothetical protein